MRVVLRPRARRGVLPVAASLGPDGPRPQVPCLAPEVVGGVQEGERQAALVRPAVDGHEDAHRGVHEGRVLVDVLREEGLREGRAVAGLGQLRERVGQIKEEIEGLTIQAAAKKREIEVMTKELVTVPVGTSLEDAEKLFHKHKIEKILMVDEAGHLKGLITIKDIQKMMAYPNACKDEHGRLRVGAALGASAKDLDRAALLGENRERRETGELLARALEELDEKYRLVFVLRDVEGMSTAETAEVAEDGADQ